MPRFSSPHDAASLFYLDYIPSSPLSASGITLLFLHGWPMSSQMFTHLLLPLSQDHNLRCIAPDRRGFGKSDWDGTIKLSPEANSKSHITFETFADDVAFLAESLDIGPFICVGASMGCGEALLLRERSKYAMENCKGLLFIGPNLPNPLRTISNPTAPSLELWNSIISSLRTSRPDFVAQSLPGIFGVPAGTIISTKTLEHYERVVAAADALAIERTCRINIERDFTDAVRCIAGKTGVPLLILHGDSDTGMPFEASTKVIAAMVPETDVRLYEKAGHGLYETHAQRVLEDIVGFVEKVERGGVE